MADEMSDNVTIGDLVWAKMKGFSPWPGKVIPAMANHPPPSVKRPKQKGVPVPKTHCVWFFGSNNFAWVEEHNVKPYLKYKERLVKTSKSGPFKEAIDAIEDYMAKKEAGEDVDKDLFNFTLNIKQERPDESDAPPPKKGKGRKPSVVEENGDEPSDKPVAPKKRRLSSTEKKTPKAANHSRKTAAVSFLDRPANVSRPDSEPLNIAHVSQTLKDKRIKPSSLTFGFLGLGIMGSAIVRNVINSGHKVIVWNRSPDKCKDFTSVGAEQGMTPSDVVLSADITVSCVSDPQAAKDMFFGNCGVLQELNPNKGYVEMTGIDPETSHDIASAISTKGGRYMEAQIQGSKSQAEEGSLVVIASGDRSLYDDCQSIFQAMGNHSFYLGDIGTAAKMNLVLQLISGVTLGALAEGMALADRAGLQQRDVMEILNLTSMSSPLIKEKGAAIVDGGFSTQLPLQHMQKDLNLALSMGHIFEQPLPLAASANEVYKHAKRLGYGEHDVSSVYIRARF